MRAARVYKRRMTLEPVLALELTHINARRSTDGLYLTINSKNSER
jgi:hypothetical protein